MIADDALVAMGLCTTQRSSELSFNQFSDSVPENWDLSQDSKVSSGSWPSEVTRRQHELGMLQERIPPYQ